jgi:hypothetical protein
MKDLLPVSVLGPRRGKTGTLTTYFAQHMRSEGLRRLTQTLPARQLETLGIIDPKRLANAVEQYCSLGSRYPHAESLFCTLQAETWLRTRCVATTESGPTRSRIGSA